jgi:hypothetical protein
LRETSILGCGNSKHKALLAAGRNNLRQTGGNEAIRDRAETPGKR